MWPPKRLTEDLMEDDYYQFVYKIGLKTSADGNEYFDYELMYLSVNINLFFKLELLGGFP